MKRPFLALPFVLLVLAGCGSSDAAPSVDDSDKQGSLIACLEDKGIAAEPDPERDNEVLLDAGPRVVFYLTAAEAEAAQFRGQGEGAEQIGSALMFVDPEVDPAMEETLAETEKCLAEL